MPERMVLPIHGADHCPGGPDPIPCIGAQSFRALIYDDNVTDIGAVDKPLLWEEWENSNPGIFDPRKNDGSADPVMGTDLARYVRLLIPGFYTFTLGCHILSDTVDGYKLVLNDSDPIFGRSDDIFGGPTDGYNSRGYCVGTWTRFYPLLDPFDSGTHTVNVDFAIAVLAGAARTVDEAYLDISYQPAR